MPIKFVHTNIVSKDVTSLANFYINTFDCQRQGSESILMGDWVEKGTKAIL